MSEYTKNFRQFTSEIKKINESKAINIGAEYTDSKSGNIASNGPLLIIENDTNRTLKLLFEGLGCKDNTIRVGKCFMQYNTDYDKLFIGLNERDLEFDTYEIE